MAITGDGQLVECDVGAIPFECESVYSVEREDDQQVGVEVVGKDRGEGI